MLTVRLSARVVTPVIAIAVLAAVACTSSPESPATVAGSADGGTEEVIPFTNIAVQALGEKAQVDNRYPGAAIFDYDRDGDLDFYVTVGEEHALLEVTTGGPNLLFRNDGNSEFTEVAEQAGVAVPESNSSGAVACDFDNDGYQDLYVGAHGRIGDNLDYRSTRSFPGLLDAQKDRLFHNNRDGTFTEITESAFGPAVNVRSAQSPACADVDGDGWPDLFVSNRGDVDFVRFNTPRHHGHYNALYRNNGDLTFSDITEDAGLMGPEIVMRDPLGDPMKFEDPRTGGYLEGYDPALLDAMYKQVGDPTGETWTSLFFDHDDDGDADLWQADDGDRLKVYRNDSTPGEIRFTLIGREMGVDKAGSWMGFAVGDYDGDADLDVFVVNIGSHSMIRPPAQVPSGDCAYPARFEWGTCYHQLFRNDGTAEAPGMGTVGRFFDVAQSTIVEVSTLMPPAVLEPSRSRRVDPYWQVPTGLAAYDFGFSAAFFDYENDGDQDLYWLGAIVARGEGPRGLDYPGGGRMLRNTGAGEFEDITVESHLIDAQGVDYSILDPDDPAFNAARQRIGLAYHENGKGLARGDLNGDGYVDLIGTNSSGEILDRFDQPEYVEGPLFMWMNGGGQNHWITLRLKGRMAVDGTGSNADALGARVYVDAKVDGDDMLTQVQEVTASSAFLSMNSLDVHFGLGAATEADEITIRWPSGVTQVIDGAKADQVLEVTEPAT